MSTPLMGNNAILMVGATTLLNTDWKIELKAIIGEAHNTTDGTKRVSGRKDYTLTASGFRDSLAPIEGQVVPGTAYTFKGYTDATKFFTGSFMVETLNIETSEDDVEKWDISAPFAGGTLTLPL